MSEDIERNFGEQPVARIMADHDLAAHDLVSASGDQITHKMVARARKGRRLTRNSQVKIRNALNTAANGRYTLDELFTYR
jgi:hypothetical protein